MRSVVGRLATGGAVALFLLAFISAHTAHAAPDKIRVGIGDVAGIDWLVVLIGLEHAKARGVDYEVTYFKSEDIAIQALINGQVDVGTGTPYTVIQKVSAPIRILMQAYKIQFYPVAEKATYPDWKALDGGEIVVHSRTSATLALANLMAQTHGITYKNITYLPGSEVRALGLLKGTIKAAYLDSTNTKMVLTKAPGRFHVLPSGGLVASDETVVAHRTFIDENPEAVDILVEEFVKVLRRVAVDPYYAGEERNRLGLLPDLPKEEEGDILAYFLLAAEDGIFDPNGGGERAARSDFTFYGAAGQIAGSPDSLKLEDFWYLDPLNKALAKLGTVQVEYTGP